MRLTASELRHAKIPFKVITDSMAAWTMKTHKIDAVLTGADQVALNGDTANKIGTYMLAVLAKHHNIPFYPVVSNFAFLCDVLMLTITHAHCYCMPSLAVLLDS
ncbi:unnamed protein product [Cylicostephanus goldi]|uniref:Uncharacterized protein n=1 Tax=Cylicostephanus goldi TaxID=71465 RepID=A0A3P6RB59_CYLGO|nr:unnamed protein product [Cylicostephanus goldi]